MNVQNLKPLSPPFFFLALAGERIFIKTLSIESGCVIGPENVLFVGASMHPLAQKLYRLRQ